MNKFYFILKICKNLSNCDGTAGEVIAELNALWNVRESIRRTVEEEFSVDAHHNGGRGCAAIVQRRAADSQLSRVQVADALRDCADDDVDRLLFCRRFTGEILQQFVGVQNLTVGRQHAGALKDAFEIASSKLHPTRCESFPPASRRLEEIFTSVGVFALRYDGVVEEVWDCATSFRKLSK